MIQAILLPIEHASVSSLRWHHALLIGFLITLLQIGFVTGLQGRKTIKAAYANLVRWDAAHYIEIAENGYRSTVPRPIPPGVPNAALSDQTNVAFFPGYPLTIRLFAMVTRLPLEWAATIVAQLFAAGFWAALLMLLSRWRVPDVVGMAAVLAVMAHPAAFYLVLPYSESLFHLSLVLFLLWSVDVGVKGWMGAGLAGMVMTGTRLFGLPLCAYPFLQALCSKDRSSMSAKTWTRLLGIGALGALGALLFFAYCQFAFGHWDLYLLRQHWGWGIRTNYLAPLTNIGDLLFPSLVNTGKDVNHFSRIMTSVTLWLLILLPLIDGAFTVQRKDDSWRARVPLYVLAWGLYYLLVSALAATGLQSMLRYAFTIHLFLMLAMAHLLSTVSPLHSVTKQGARGLFILVAAGLFYLQWMLLHTFTHGGWVA